METLLILLKLLMAVAIICIIVFAGYCGGYENGQSDALVHRWYWMATEQPDGTMVFSHLNKVSADPVIARAK